MARKVLEMQDVSFSYGSIHALENVSFSVQENDLIGIIGPNGGGKTTLLKLVLGLLGPQKGKVSVFGKTPKEGRKRIGYVPQVSRFDRNFPIDAFSVVLMGRLGRASPWRPYSPEDSEAARKALDSVGMGKHANRQVSELSGGQLQRVLLARALVTEPELLLLDEPMSSLDPEAQLSFYETLNKLKKGMAIMVVTHDIAAVSVYLDKLACLNRKLFYHGKVKEGIKHLEKTYQCPIELIAHGVPHRVVRRHK